MHCLEFPEQCYITNHTKHPNLQVFSFKYDIKVVFQGVQFSDNILLLSPKVNYALIKKIFN